MPFLKTIATPIFKQARKIMFVNVARNVHHLHIHGLSDETIENKFIEYFNKADLDGWDVRQGLNDLAGMDFVPSPELAIAVMYACRRVNDYAIAIRFLESVKNKCGGKEKEIYPYVIQEIMPVLVELGIETPEELGFDKPEFYISSVYDIH